MIKIAMIGFGVIAHAAHLKPHLELEARGEVKLVAVCDICPERFDEKVEINIGGSDVTLNEDVKRYTDWREMLGKEDVDMVDICVPTYLHAEIAIAALKSGHHVLCEKPMSLTYEKCLEMCDAAKSAGKKLMIGQCVRFGAATAYLKKEIEAGTYGKIKTGIFRRLSPPPVWGWDNWYMDIARSGGSVMDLHVHDLDYIRYAFGEPKKVSCCIAGMYSPRDVAHSRLVYDDFSIMAVGDWSREGVPFESGFMLAFEKATVMFSSADGVFRVYPRGGEEYTVELPKVVSYQQEIEYFVGCINGKHENEINPPESSAMSVKLANALIESAEKCGEFVMFS